MFLTKDIYLSQLKQKKMSLYEAQRKLSLHNNNFFFTFIFLITKIHTISIPINKYHSHLSLDFFHHIDNLSPVHKMFSLFQKKPEQSNQRCQMVSPRRKPLSEVFYEEKSAKLPHGFAQNIMDLEMQLEFPETYSLEAVMKLNELYRIAIQHYIDEDPRKASHFQRKLTSLLTNPQSLELMDKKAQENKQNLALGVKSPERQSKVSAGCSYSSNLRKQMSQFNCQSDILVKSIIEGTQKKVERNHRFVQNHLMTQEEKLKLRLQQRSRSKKQRSIDVKQ